MSPKNKEAKPCKPCRPDFPANSSRILEFNFEFVLIYRVRFACALARCPRLHHEVQRQEAPAVEEDRHFDRIAPPLYVPSSIVGCWPLIMIALSISVCSAYQVCQSLSLRSVFLHFSMLFKSFEYLAEVRLS